MDNEKAKSLLDFLGIINQLKSSRRRGWVLDGIPDCESIASHMYQMALLAFCLPADGSVDKDKCIKMALVHDMAEAIVGDIVPSDGIKKEIKHKMEEQAMAKICSLVEPHVSDEFTKLWQEYEAQESAEAKVVKDLDRFDMIYQAFQYEQQLNKPKYLQDYYDSTKGKFNSTQVQSWVSELYERRNQHSADGEGKP